MRVLSKRQGHCRMCGHGVEVRVIQTTITEKPVTVFLCHRCDTVHDA